jgi:hypothetical protein
MPVRSLVSFAESRALARVIWRDQSQSAALWEELSPPASEALELAGNDDYLIGPSLDWCDWTDTEVELTPVESASVTRVEDCFETSGRKHKLDAELHPEHSNKRAKRVHDSELRVCVH